MFEANLADFAKSTGAGRKKRIVLQLDNAGWHGPENLAVPDGLRLVFQPPHSPELQPAEHLWAFVDEPLANTHFASIEDLDRAVGDRCLDLMDQQETTRASTLFHWWPQQAKWKWSFGAGITTLADLPSRPRSGSRSTIWVSSTATPSRAGRSRWCSPNGSTA